MKCHLYTVRQHQASHPWFSYAKSNANPKKERVISYKKLLLQGSCAPSLLTPDVIRAPRQTAPAVVQQLSPRSGIVPAEYPVHTPVSLRERIRRGQPRQQAAELRPTLQDAAGQPYERGERHRHRANEQQAHGAGSRDFNALLHAPAWDAVQAPLCVH